MWPTLFCVFLVFLVENASAYGPQQQLMCGNTTQQRALGCTTQILGEEHAILHRDSCQVEYFPSDSAECKAMSFGPIAPNSHIGKVSLKPYILDQTFSGYADNFTVLNITFSSIKWKTMKFRFQLAKQKHCEKYCDNHCRNIVLSNEVTVSKQSVLYYDCYWSLTDGNYNGQSHILDFEATDDKAVNRGQYYFNIPSAQMLSPQITVDKWVPFLYIEIISSMLQLHITPPPPHIAKHIKGYGIEVRREGDDIHKSISYSSQLLTDKTSEVVLSYGLLTSGSHYFVVSALHGECFSSNASHHFKVACQTVESPRVFIYVETENLNICIASIAALIVATLFAYYVVLRLIRRYWCKNYELARASDVQIPTKALVVYSPSNRLHAECVNSFVDLLRHDYGLDVTYDGDISNTSHKDPFTWATESYERATHVIYIVGPKTDANIYNNIYDQPIINPHKKIDTLILNRLQQNSVAKNKKEVINVYFEHSNGKVPIETKLEKSFYLLKDWNKMTGNLSKNLLPKQIIGKSDKGQSFLDDLSRAKKMLGNPKPDLLC